MDGEVHKSISECRNEAAGSLNNAIKRNSQDRDTSDLEVVLHDAFATPQGRTGAIQARDIKVKYQRFGLTLCLDGQDHSPTPTSSTNILPFCHLHSLISQVSACTWERAWRMTMAHTYKKQLGKVSSTLSTSTSTSTSPTTYKHNVITC